MRLLSSLLFTSLVVSLIAHPRLQAQEPDLGLLTGGQEELVDRIVAVVGDSAIFYSQIQEHLLRLEASGAQLPQDDQGIQRLERDALDELVSQSLVVQAATRDTLVSVSQTQVDATLEDAWADEIRRWGSEAALRQALSGAGMTVTEYRSQLREDLHRQMLLERFVQLQRRESRPPPVEESEIRAFYERERENIGSRPATLSFRQAVILPQPSEEATAEARAEAERILGLIRDGGDFEDLARRFSDDPGSGQRGGELGWIRRGAMVREFEDAAFRLSRGQVSNVVESVFGAHIIRVDRVRGAERMVRHILIGAETTDADVERARARAEEIMDAVRAGTPIQEFADESGETGLPDTLTLAMDQLGQLPGAYATVLRAADEGDVVGPVQFQTPQGQPAFAVVHVYELRDEGEYTYEDVRDQIRQILEQERFEDRLVERLRDRTYVEIRW